MENYNFEEFSSVGGKFQSKISLGEAGFGLSAGFVLKNGLEKTIGVKLYYDKQKRAVGFKFLTKDEPNMLRLTLRKEKGANLGAQSFINKYGIDRRRYAGKYDPKVVNVDGHGTIYVLELKESSVNNV